MEKEQRMIQERVKQFCCDPSFYPYLIKVLDRLPEEVLYGEILGDQRLEIISIDPRNHGRSLRLPHPTRHLIILSEALLESPDHEILHTIAHEIGHRVAGAGKTGLWEKEAEDLVRAWGFTEESKKAAYLPALFEMEGYRMGQLWASRQSDLAEFLGFHDEWRSGSISPDRINELVEQVKAKKIHLEIAPLEVSAKDMLLQLVFNRSHTLELALAIGVMTFLEESNELSPVETCAPTSVEDGEIYASATGVAKTSSTAMQACRLTV